MSSYFGLASGTFFPSGLYDSPISPNNNPLYNFMIEDGFNVHNMIQIGYPSLISNKYLEDYSIDYSCFGWALGVNSLIESVLESGGYVSNFGSVFK